MSAAKRLPAAAGIGQSGRQQHGCTAAGGARRDGRTEGQHAGSSARAVPRRRGNADEPTRLG
uniref:p0660F12.13 protein n=1 Tax=Oryza sativa subsp. japonica TaxID=39947 RepID=Q94CR6_ORYSJ|nr:P0660F12.13 [Oryza sativa Japonica Group]